MVPSNGTIRLTYWPIPPIPRTRSLGAKLLHDYSPHRSFVSCRILFGYVMDSSSDQNTKLLRSPANGVLKNVIVLQHHWNWWATSTRAIHASNGPVLLPFVSSSCRDYYNLLGLNKKNSSSLIEIKKVYYGLVKKLHPDKNSEGDAKEKTKLFQEVQKAYEVLKDEKKRSLYDRVGHDAFEQGATGYGGGDRHFDDGGFGPFEAILVRTSSGGYHGFTTTFRVWRLLEKRGHKILDSVGIVLSKLEAVEGCTKIVTFRTCSYCEACSSFLWPPPQVRTSSFWCDESCDSTNEEQRLGYCKTCKGDGVVIRSNTMSIKLNVTAGVNDNDKLLIDRYLNGETYIVTIKIRKKV